MVLFCFREHMNTYAETHGWMDGDQIDLEDNLRETILLLSKWKGVLLKGLPFRRNRRSV
jgi:hypothetical protein